MFYLDLVKLHPLLAHAFITKEGDWWCARTMIGGRFIVGNGKSPWEALGNMLLNTDLDRQIKAEGEGMNYV